MDISDALRDFFIRTGKSDTPLPDDHSLLASGLIDSLAIVQLLEFIESEFSVTVSDTEFDPDNFESISSITAMIKRMQQ